MAIVDMLRLDVLMMQRDQAEFIKMMQRAGCVQFVPVQTDAEQPAGSQAQALGRTEELLSRVRWAISRLLKYDPVKQSMFRPLPQAKLESLEDSNLDAVMDVVAQLEALEQQNGELRGHQTRLTQTAEQLKPWLGLGIPSGRLRGTAATAVFSGQASARGLNKLAEDWQGRPAIISVLSSERDTAFFYAVVHQSLADELLSDLRAAGYQPALPLSGEGTPREQLDRIYEELAQLRAESDRIQEETSRLGVHLPALRLAFEALSARQSRLDAQEQMARTGSTAMMSGWVPKHLAGELSADIKKSFPDAQTALREPQEGEEPPVLLHNSPITRPYEAVVTGFALPAFGALDPTSVMMPFFACFFGMMVSDAGYGLLMALLIPLMVKFMQPSEGARKLFWILAGGGLATVVWGALYNTWFGFGPWPSVFDPVNNSLPVMAVCIGIGALHLFTGLGLGAAQNIRKGDYLSVVYDQLSWAMLVIGLGLLALPQTAGFGKWLAIAGAVIVLLTAGRNKTNNPIKRLVSGLGALYGVTGWISDLLSYMRLFGMGLATGVIGMVINQLVGMMMGGGIIGMVLGAVVFVGAHLFNAAINILGAYVHACRLQYIEFFGKFYEEGGKPFKPLRLAPRYVRIQE